MDQNRSNFSLNDNNEIAYFNSIETIIHKISYYEDFVKISLGIIGNLISIFILIRPSLNKKSNTGLLFTIICLLNLIIILNEGLKKWLDIQINMEMLYKRVLEHSLSWIQALISIDRFISLFFPIKGARIMNRKRVIFSIVVCLFVFITIIQYVFYSTILTSDRKDINELLHILVFNDILIKTLISYLIIVLLDLMVIVRRLKRIWNTEIQETATEPIMSKSSKFAINTILIDFIFLILNLPSILDYYISFKVLEASFNGPFLASNMSLAFEVLSLFTNIYSHLFFILFVIFNRIFTHEFISIFKCNRYNNINRSSS